MRSMSLLFLSTSSSGPSHLVPCLCRSIVYGCQAVSIQIHIYTTKSMRKYPWNPVFSRKFSQSHPPRVQLMYLFLPFAKNDFHQPSLLDFSPYSWSTQCPLAGDFTASEPWMIIHKVRLKHAEPALRCEKDPHKSNQYCWLLGGFAPKKLGLSVQK